MFVLSTDLQRVKRMTDIAFNQLCGVAKGKRAICLQTLVDSV